jgi:hypothetical protein
MTVRQAGSADEVVRAVRILYEVLRIPARISAAVLREEDTVCVTSPSWTCASHVLRSKTLRKIPLATARRMSSTNLLMSEVWHQCRRAPRPPRSSTLSACKRVRSSHADPSFDIGIRAPIARQTGAPELDDPRATLTGSEFRAMRRVSRAMRPLSGFARPSVSWLHPAEIASWLISRCRGPAPQPPRAGIAGR